MDVDPTGAMAELDRNNVPSLQYPPGSDFLLMLTRS
jgi:hypothetical protein